MTTSPGLELHKTVSDRCSIDFFSLLYSSMKAPLVKQRDTIIVSGCPDHNTHLHGHPGKIQHRRDKQ